MGVKGEYPLFAVLAQLGERKTEDLEVTGSIPVGGKKRILLFVRITILEQV